MNHSWIICEHLMSIQCEKKQYGAGLLFYLLELHVFSFVLIKDLAVGGFGIALVNDGFPIGRGGGALRGVALRVHGIIGLTEEVLGVVAHLIDDMQNEGNHHEDSSQKDDE